MVAVEGYEDESMQARPVYVAAVDLSCKFHSPLSHFIGTPSCTCIILSLKFQSCTCDSIFIVEDFRSHKQSRGSSVGKFYNIVSLTSACSLSFGLWGLL